MLEQRSSVMEVDKIILALDAAWKRAGTSDMLVGRATRLGIRMTATELAHEYGAEHGGFTILKWLKDHPINA